MSDTTDTDSVILDATREGVAVLRLNRPERHNAFNPQVIELLTDHLDTIRGTPSIRAVLLAATGRSFSAGADIEWMRFAGDYTHDDNKSDAEALANMLHKLHGLEALTIALVNGTAMGGGLGLIAACDVALCVKSAEFRFSEVRMGLTPATISPYVIEAIGPRWARMLFVTGKPFGAELALQMGLIHGAFDDMNSVMAEADKYVDLAFHAAPDAVRDAKKLVADVMWREINGGLRHMTAARIADRRSSAEGREGLTAFLEKRKPYWAE